MDLDFSPEQEELRRQVQRVLARLCDREVVRSVFDGPEMYAKELWREVSSLGWLAASVPEEFGGLGLGYVASCVIGEELGRALAPIPFSSSVYLAIEAIVTFGSAAQRQRYLPSLLDGTVIGTGALADSAGPLLTSAATASVREGRLTGVKMAVPDGMSAGVAVVSVRGEPGCSTLYLVDSNQPEVEREPSESIDPSRPLATLRFTNAIADGLGGTLEQLLDRVAVLLAFEQLGGAETALEKTRAYALERYAFGRPVGSFQAIKHKLANVYVANELARSHAYNAVCLLEENSLQLAVAAASARIAATEAFERASREMIQVHGGIAFTWESDCHLYYRRSRQLALELGAPFEWRDRLIDLIGGRRARGEKHELS